MAPRCSGYHYCGVSEIRDGEDLWQWFRLEIRLNAFRRSTIPQKQFIIIIIIIIIITDPICSCRTNAVENTERYLLHCSNFTNQRTVLFDDLRRIGINYGPLDSSSLSRMLLFGNPKFSDNVNNGIISTVINFIESTSRCSGSIYD